MTLTSENHSTQRRICPTATLFTTNPTWTEHRPLQCDKKFVSVDLFMYTLFNDAISTAHNTVLNGWVILIIIN